MAGHPLTALLCLFYVAAAAAQDNPQFCMTAVPCTSTTTTAVQSAQNIRQCSFVDLDDQQKEGLIASCYIDKLSDSTTLKVTWNTMIRVNPLYGLFGCRRWFVKINGQECQSPATIDTYLSCHTDIDSRQRPSSVEGFCNDVPAGAVTVTIHIGDCPFAVDNPRYNTGNPTTGVFVTSRIILEEITVADPSYIA